MCTRPTLRLLIEISSVWIELYTLTFPHVIISLSRSPRYRDIAQHKPFIIGLNICFAKEEKHISLTYIDNYHQLIIFQFHNTFDHSQKNPPFGGPIWLRHLRKKQVEYLFSCTERYCHSSTTLRALSFCFSHSISFWCFCDFSWIGLRHLREVKVFLFGHFSF